MYALVPWDEYRELFEGRPDAEVFIPHEVILLEEELDCSLIRAWREHLGLTQAQAAERMGVSQPSYARMEAKSVYPRVVTLKRIAKAMGIEWEQLRG